MNPGVIVIIVRGFHRMCVSNKKGKAVSRSVLRQRQERWRDRRGFWPGRSPSSVSALFLFTNATASLSGYSLLPSCLLPPFSLRVLRVLIVIFEADIF